MLCKLIRETVICTLTVEIQTCGELYLEYIIHMYILAQMMVPRVSFFPLVYEKLEKQYARAAGKQAEDELWLSAETTPLKWWAIGCWVLCIRTLYIIHTNRHYPVGVLYDLYGRGMNLPWEITVHFRVCVGPAP